MKMIALGFDWHWCTSRLHYPVWHLCNERSRQKYDISISVWGSFKSLQSAAAIINTFVIDCVSLDDAGCGQGVYYRRHDDSFHLAAISHPDNVAFFCPEATFAFPAWRGCPLSFTFMSSFVFLSSSIAAFLFTWWNLVCPFWFVFTRFVMHPIVSLASVPPLRFPIWMATDK